jgi:hypothetical protein
MRALTNLFASRAFYSLVPERSSPTAVAVRLLDRTPLQAAVYGSDVARGRRRVTSG